MMPMMMMLGAANRAYENFIDRQTISVIKGGLSKDLSYNTLYYKVLYVDRFFEKVICIKMSECHKAALDDYFPI